MLTTILINGLKWAVKHGIKCDDAYLQVLRSSTAPIYLPVLQDALKGLVEDLGQSGRTVFILIDEIQRLYAVDQHRDGESAADFFKSLVGPAQPYGNATVAFAVTGSSMCQAWLAFSKVTPNEHTLADLRRTINIPLNQDEHVFEVAYDLLCHRWWAFTNKALTSGSDLLRALLSGPSRDPAWLCYLARMYEPLANVQEAYNVASMKLLTEFAEEIQAIAKVLLSEDVNCVTSLLHLVSNGTAEAPEQFLTQQVYEYCYKQIYEYYYKPYVQEVTLNDGTTVWKMLPSIYCEIVKLAIKPDEKQQSLKLIEDEDIAATAGSGGPLLDCFVNYAEAAGWLLWYKPFNDPAFMYVLQHPKNKETCGKNIKKYIRAGGCSKHWVVYQFWRMLRNVVSHHVESKTDGRFVDYHKLLYTLPACLPQVALDLQKQRVD
eukprot:14620-Heterococcus_DN1.PRE.7